MLSILKYDVTNSNNYHFWLTIKSSFKNTTIDSLVNDNTIGFRYNFSKEDNIERLINLIKYINNRYPSIRVMLDIGGSKERITIISEPLKIKKGEKCTIYNTKNNKVELGIGISDYLYSFIKNNRKKNDVILISDGWQQLKICEIKNEHIICEALFDSVIYDKRGISVKDLYDSKRQDYDEDIKKIQYIKQKCTITDIAVSFVNKALDIEYVMNRLGSKKVSIISKIESMKGLINIVDIAKSSDEVMIARGDLYVELSLNGLDIKKSENLIISACDLYNKKIIMATRVADSLETDDSISSDDVIKLVSDIQRTKEHVFLLSGETSFNEAKANINYEIINNTINKIISNL